MPARPGFERDWHFDEKAIITGASFSGHERNRLFLNLGGVSFEDVSGISGLDAETDGRVFALFDFDRDGWQDVVIVNANAPLIELFRNRIAEHPDGSAAGNRTVALRFVGANHSAQAAPGRSNRDGVGVRVEVGFADQVLYREQRAGEGFAAQNSATMIVGVGARDSVDRVTVKWPSGQTQELRDVPTGLLVEVFEGAEQSPTGENFVTRPRKRALPARAFAARAPLELPRRVFPLHRKAQDETRPRLVLYTTMATWCATCQGELPHWSRLRELFSASELEIRAVPVDNADTPEKLERYVERHQPAYRLLSDLSASDVAQVNATVLSELGKDGLPASFVTDTAGRILDSTWSAPTVSRLRQLLLEQGETSFSRNLAAARAEPGVNTHR